MTQSEWHSRKGSLPGVLEWVTQWSRVNEPKAVVTGQEGFGGICNWGIEEAPSEKWEGTQGNVGEERVSQCVPGVSFCSPPSLDHGALQGLKKVLDWVGGEGDEC